MNLSKYHTFHIPVMGLGFTIDTPLKVARFGISSVISIVEDNLVEQMRKFYCEKYNEEYIPITQDNINRRALRITGYLNLLNRIVKKQMEVLKAESFEEGNEIVKYFELLPTESPIKKQYFLMLDTNQIVAKKNLQEQLRSSIVAGDIDVNIMTKGDKINYAS